MGGGAAGLRRAGTQREGANTIIVLRLTAAFMPRCLTREADAHGPAKRSRW